MPPPCKLTFDLLSFKVVSESHVTWATCVPILVFLSLFVLNQYSYSYIRPRPDVRVRQRDRQTDVRRASSLNAPYPSGGGHNDLTNTMLKYLSLVCTCTLFIARFCRRNVSIYRSHAGIMSKLIEISSNILTI